MSEPDILVRLCDCIIYTAAHNMDGLTAALNDAHDEIEALRAQLRTAALNWPPVMGRIRTDALEEAARYCERLRVTAFGEPQDDIGYNNQLCDRFAAGIRALKDKGDA